jgi:cell division protein FtsI/penicillin-binding protein 2
MQGTMKERQATINNRLPVVIGGLVIISALMLLALARYQWLSPDVQREFELRGQFNNQSVKRLPAVRGVIFDRDGIPLAFNTLQYEVGVSPDLISDPLDVTRRLVLILNQNGYDFEEYDLLQRIGNPNSAWELIARPVSAEVGQRIADENLLGVVINPLSRRTYPQQELAGPVIGFTTDEGGAMGVELSYNDYLAGSSIDQTVSNIPIELAVDLNSENQRGRDVMLTIDRDIQFWIESELQRALVETDSEGGTIIVMNPRNGDILGMASAPAFNPNTFGNIENEGLLRNRAIEDSYEPGSVMKVLTVAGALDSGIITRDWTYNDTGQIEVGGRVTENWDDRAYGITSLDDALVNSLNVGMATIALEMKPELFYNHLQRFGIGQPTRIDLPGEQSGILKVFGDSDWSESDLATNSYGQGVTVTPLQMITAVSAIANDGLMYQPRIVREIVNDDTAIPSRPSVLSRAVSAETADTVTDMMIRVVEEGAPLARLEGYTIAGKTGTAQIPSPVGYEAGPKSSIVSFVGFFPADDPQVVVLVKLDRPRDYWGSQVAAPVFRQIAQRLVILMGIPNDDVRLRLEAEGGRFNNNP